MAKQQKWKCFAQKRMQYLMKYLRMLFIDSNWSAPLSYFFSDEIAFLYDAQSKNADKMSQAFEQLYVLNDSERSDSQ